MGKRLFGTDGMRGVAGEPPLDAKTVTALGIALGDDLRRQRLDSRPVLIGMDTRESGPAIAAQLAAGLAQRGLIVRFAGVITTPGVAYLTRTGDFAAGVMISASHNPYADNGIKVFARTGYKLPDAEEHEIEEEIFRILPDVEVSATPAALARTFDARPYLDFLLSTIQVPLKGCRVAIDCGNGAASALAPQLFREAGAEVTAICNEPNGRNINLGCGALHVGPLRKAGARIGRVGRDRIRWGCGPRHDDFCHRTAGGRRRHDADCGPAAAGGRRSGGQRSDLDGDVESGSGESPRETRHRDGAHAGRRQIRSGRDASPRRQAGR
jgi:phosphoglucosamine mutase